MRTFGLIGYPLSHSFSQKYFTEKFAKENIKETEYKLFPLEEISAFKQLIENESTLKGLNVTIPYKETIISFLHELDQTAKEVGAVNTIKVTDDLKLIGYNTDIIGFRESLKPLLASHHERALILGTGGAAKAVNYVLTQIGVACSYVSRNRTQLPSGEKVFDYKELNRHTMEAFHLIVNTTPLGMHPNSNTCPEIPYEYLTPRHLLYDLVYNPEQTMFLKKGKEKNTITQNGLNMLYLQAEKAWEIWNNN